MCMRVLVLGAGGVGSAVVAIASRRQFFDAMIVADIQLDRAERAVARSGDSRLSAVVVDAADSAAVAELCRKNGVTHLLNAVDPRFVLPIFSAALLADADYLDMAMSFSE